MSKLLEQIPRGVWIEFADDGKKVVDIIHEPKDAIMPDRYVWCQECKSGVFGSVRCFFRYSRKRLTTLVDE